MKPHIIPLLIGLFVMPFSSYAWDGYDYSTGSYISVETYDHGGTGSGEVEYFDYQTGTYRYGYLDMYSGGSGSLYDYETGEVREVQMD